MKILYSCFLGMMLLCSIGAYAKIIPSGANTSVVLECDPQICTVVKGYPASATKKVTVYATSQGEKVTSLRLLFSLPAGVTMSDGQTQGDTESVTFRDAILSNNAVVATSVYDGELLISISQSIFAFTVGANIMNLPNGVRTPLIDIEFMVDIDATDAVALTPQIVLEQCSGATHEDVICATDNLKVSFNLLRESYGFTTNPGAKVVLNEDAGSVSIAATDTALFNAVAWDLLAESMVATNAVKFSDVEVLDPNVGTVDIVNGKIVYTPAAEYNGDFTIVYTAMFTGIADAEVTGSIDVTVNPVNDTPEISIATENLEVFEDENLTFDLRFDDSDSKWDDFT